MTAPVNPQFLPFLRLGLAGHITTRAEAGLAPHDTSTVSVRVSLQASGAEAELNQEVPSPRIRLRGPGEVSGLDPSLIVRSDPAPGTVDAEANYLALVEFSAADLPWRYTPAAASGGLLQPWIALVVVEDGPGAQLETSPVHALSVLQVSRPSEELPDLRQSWAWAHVHADRALDAGVAAALNAAPAAFRSRLLCPRRLGPERRWIACVVPVFESGRRAGLREPVSDDMGLAWTHDREGALRLPVYHSWRFETGPGGDFKSLVQRLRARELPPDVGRRDLDISDPGAGLPVAPGTVISYEGALLSPGGRSRKWPEPHRTRMKAALAELVDRPLERGPTPTSYDALRDDPAVGAPAYVANQAGRSRLPAQAEPPLWFGQLNSEPQHRAVASLGAAVIRKDQEPLMAIAWKYAAEAAAATRSLSRARLAWELARRRRPRFDSLPDAAFLQLAAPAMARLPSSSRGTIHGVVTASALPRGLFSGAFRRLSRTAPGFVKVTSTDRVGTTVAITRAAVSDAQSFVAVWATVRAPASANVTEPAEAAAPRTGAASPESQRTAVGGIPFDGDVSELPALAATARSALDPQRTIRAMVEARVLGLPATREQDVPDRLRVQPRFTTAMYRRLVSLSVEYLVPGIGDIPADTLGLLKTNPVFVEAFLAGLNHELGREFVWREYPARLEDTWFQRFWSAAGAGAADIVPIQRWDDAALGVHAPKDTPQASLVLLVKSPLLRRYPDVRIYAAEARWQNAAAAAAIGGGSGSAAVREEASDGKVQLPLFVARLGPDVAAFGFDLNVRAARGSTDPNRHPGYFFVFEQAAGSPRFGLGAKQSDLAGQAPGNWSQLSWSHLVREGEPLPDFVDCEKPKWLVDAGALRGNGATKDDRDAWGDGAAAMARITLQRPTRMLVHADSMLPAAAAQESE